jgi:D-serine deaminase-like pyridoxal phosphate-dependent protein
MAIAAASLESMAQTPDAVAVPTPYLAVDLDTMERNIERMQRFYDGKPANIRPHAKTHKCTEIARAQLDAGAVGITCSTTDEVAAMTAAGIPDVLLANVVLDRNRLRSLAQSALRTRVTCAVDSSEAVSRLAAAAREAGARIGVVVDCDVCMGRNGVHDVEVGVAVASQAADEPGLELRGVMAYEGSLLAIEDREERGRAVVDAFTLPVTLLHELRRLGHEAPILTGGATGTYDSTGLLPDMTDVQAGTYVLMDATYGRRTPEFECAIALVATVSTVRRGGRIVVDAGAKRLAAELGHPLLLGYDAEHAGTAEEHTIFQSTGGAVPAAGTRVAVVPAHVCTTMSMYGSARGYRNGAFDHALVIDGRDPLAS